MKGYKQDREFTDKNHKLAEYEIYAKYGIEILHPITPEEKEDAEKADIYEAIDYIGYIEKSGIPFAIQERTREAKYGKFNDVTIRFERPQNTHEDRKQSEFYKLDAYFQKNPDTPFLLMYAVRGEDKENEVIEKDTTFSKYAFLDLRKLYNHIKKEEIVVADWVDTPSSYVHDGIMYAPIIDNNDPSSNFIPFDVGQLVEYFPDVVLEQQGFNAPKIPLEPGYSQTHLYAKIQGTSTVKQRNCIEYLAKLNNYITDNNALRNLSIREASDVIQIMNSNPSYVIEKYPDTVLELQPQRRIINKEFNR